MLEECTSNVRDVRTSLGWTVSSVSTSASAHTIPFKLPHAGPGARAGARDAGSRGGDPLWVQPGTASPGRSSVSFSGDLRARMSAGGGLLWNSLESSALRASCLDIASGRLHSTPRLDFRGIYAVVTDRQRMGRPGRFHAQGRLFRGFSFGWRAPLARNALTDRQLCVPYGLGHVRGLRSGLVRCYWSTTTISPRPIAPRANVTEIIRCQIHCWARGFVTD